MQNLDKVIEQFHENGIAVVEGFATDAECDAMRAQMRNIVDQTDMKVLLLLLSLTTLITLFCIRSTKVRSFVVLMMKRANRRTCLNETTTS